jgi:hypothetical protein
MVRGGEDEVGAVHVKVFRAEWLGDLVGIRSWDLIELGFAHENKPG